MIGVSRGISSVASFLIVGAAVAQDPGGEARAVERAKSFIQGLTGESLSRTVIADRIAERNGTQWSYLVELYRSDSDFVSVGVYHDGRIYGYSDLGLAELIRARRQRLAAKLRNPTDALVVAQRYVQLAGLDARKLEEVRHKPIGESEAAADDGNNRRDRWLVELRETVPGFDGAVNTLGLTLDVVTGGVVMAAGGFGLEYEPFERLLDDMQALGALRQLCLREGVSGSELHRSAFRWPGEATARANLSRILYSRGTACGGEEYGSALRERLAVRACFKTTFVEGGHTVALVVDAENGRPVDAYIVKSSRAAAAAPDPSVGSEARSSRPDSRASRRAGSGDDGSWRQGLVAAVAVSLLAILGFVHWLRRSQG